MYYRRLKGENLYLSPADIANEYHTMTKWLNEDRDLIYQNDFYRRLLGEDKTKEMLEKWNAGPYMFSIVRDEDDVFMGHVSLFNIAQHSVTLGIYLGPEYRAKGYGKEAMELIKKYIFDDLGYCSIHIEVLSYNTRAIKFYENLGFVICGTWHQERYAGGKYHDIILMEYLKQK